jgi:ABC-2 type transport system ATP-binding protein
MEEADSLCDRLAIMDHGRILALDTPRGLKESVGADSIVTVSATGDLDALGPLLVDKVSGATGSTRVDNTVLLQVKGTVGVLPQVIAAADHDGFTVTDLSVAEPTLETVFINLTGKDLRD